MKKLIALLLALTMVFALCACGASETAAPADDAAAAPAAEGEKLTIAFSTIAYSIAVLPQYLIDQLDALCGAEGWEFVMLAAEGDAELQGQQVSTLISKQPDYLVLFPADPMLAIDWCAEAEAAGIPTIAVHVDVDESCHGTSCDAYCGIDNEAVATAIHDYMVEKNPDGANIVEIGGVPVQADYIVRTGTFNGLLSDNYKQLGEIGWAYSSRADAQGFMENFIGSYGDDIDVLVGFDDDLTLGGVNALQERGMTDVQVYSITGQKEAMQAIKDGKMTMTVFTSMAKEAEKVVETIKALEAGQTVDYFQYIETPVVDASNVDQYADQAEF